MRIINCTVEACAVIIAGLVREGLVFIAEQHGDTVTITITGY